MQLKPLSRLRTFFQLISAILSNAYIVAWFKSPFLYMGSAKAITPPILNCYACPSAIVSCPVGSVQHFMVIKAFPYYVLGFLVILGASVGRFFCGWACPFGLVQDILARIKKVKIAIPKFLLYGKYIVLIAAVFVIPYLAADTIFCKICPQGALEGGIPQILLQPQLRHLIGLGNNNQENLSDADDEEDFDNVSTKGLLYWIKISLLILIIGCSILIKRPFCRVICPLGAFMAIFNKISFLQMSVAKERCTNCLWCRKVCPVDINIHDDPNSPECLRCGLCTACPASAVRFATVFSSPKSEIA